MTPSRRICKIVPDKPANFGFRSSVSLRIRIAAITPPLNPLPLSVAIITLNEEEDLPRCLQSVSTFASEIVVIDSGSTDRTAEIARRYGARFEVRPWPGYIAQKNAALDACTQPWVLSLDADEAVSPELEASLRKLFGNGDPKPDGFYLNRFNYYLGGWIRHCWSPEWRLRLVRRGRARWGGLDPHDKLELQGSDQTARLKGNLLHFLFTNIPEHLEKTLKFARIMAESYHKSGRKFRLHQIIFTPFFAWAKVIIVKQGWRDGWRGFLIAGTRWINVFAKYAYLYQLQHLTPERKNPEFVIPPSGTSPSPTPPAERATSTTTR